MSMQVRQKNFSKLDEWNYDNIVIPHGQSWGYHVPLGTSWDDRLNADGHDPDKQILLEIMSGHGNSEEYRDIASANFLQDGEMICPEPTDDFLPCCWQAGEIQKNAVMDSPKKNVVQELS